MVLRRRVRPRSPRPRRAAQLWWKYSAAPWSISHGSPCQSSMFGLCQDRSTFRQRVEPDDPRGELGVDGRPPGRGRGRRAGSPCPRLRRGSPAAGPAPPRPARRSPSAGRARPTTSSGTGRPSGAAELAADRPRPPAPSAPDRRRGTSRRTCRGRRPPPCPGSDPPSRSGSTYRIAVIRRSATTITVLARSRGRCGTRGGGNEDRDFGARAAEPTSSDPSEWWDAVDATRGGPRTCRRVAARPARPVGARPLSVYLHVPFCATRCGYCDFNTYTAGRARSGPRAAARTPTGARRGRAWPAGCSATRDLPV